MVVRTVVAKYANPYTDNCNNTATKNSDIGD